MVHTLSALLLLSFSEQIGSEAVHVTSPLNQFIMSTIMNSNNSTTWSYGYRSLHIFLKSPQKTRLLTSCLDFWQYFHASLQLAKKKTDFMLCTFSYTFSFLIINSSSCLLCRKRKILPQKIKKVKP